MFEIDLQIMFTTPTALKMDFTQVSILRTKRVPVEFHSKIGNCKLFISLLIMQLEKHIYVEVDKLLE